MKKIFILIFFYSLIINYVFAQINCSGPLQVNVCPTAYLSNQTNAGMLDDAPALINLTGEDLVYAINTPSVSHMLYVSLVNLTGFARLSLLKDSCGASLLSGISVSSGNSNVSFNLLPGSLYYLFVDAPDTINFDISIGVDTATSFVNIPNTLGSLQFDGACASPAFAGNKPYFQVTYNGIAQTNPMTLSPLFATGSLCVKTFFKNTSGVEGIKKFSFSFTTGGFSSISCPATVPGFYNAGNWVRSGFTGGISYSFVDSAGIGRGDFTCTPNNCLGYEFCFDVVPLTNDPVLTDVVVNALSDGFGSGFNGWVYQGCCPLPNPNCFPVLLGAGFGAVSAFSFSFDDPGNPLPIVLKSFNTILDNRTVRLNWTTASEINNDYFTIERAENIGEWNAIGKIPGFGNSTVNHSYFFNDKPGNANTYFYRLKQTDFDGKFTYSEIRVVEMHSSDDIVIYPNPVLNYFTVQSNKVRDFQFYFQNIYGEKISLPAIFHPFEVTFQTSDLKNGIYLLVVKNQNSIVKLEKIIVEH